MSSGIFISNQGKKKWIESIGFEKEEDLQKYITEHPESIPLSQINDQVKLKIISREFYTSHKERIDHIGIDQNGEIYLIETKHYTNPDKRHIVSQVLDYGATLSDYDFKDFLSKIEVWIKTNESANSLLDLIQQYYSLDEDSANEIIENFENNFLTNKFKFIILMDQTDEKIKQFVKFLNANSNFSIFLIEYKRYVDADVEIITPILFGADSIKKDRLARSSWNWTEDDFFENVDLEEHLSNEQKIAIRKFISFIIESLNNQNEGKILWDRRKIPTFIVILYKFSQSRYLFYIRPDGKMKLNFEFSNNQEQKFRDEFRKSLSEIKGLETIEQKNSKRDKVLLDTSKWIPAADKIAYVIKKSCFDTNN